MAHPQTPPTFSPVITGSDEYSVELNDANLTTKAWRSSRYDGSKTETAVLNKYSEGDISIGKTTAVQKYSRNIYLGNGVIGMDENGGEDITLVNFPNFSYITTLKYITVNADNTISTDIVESKPDDFNSRRGFYRSFYEDFPEESSCKIIVNDISTKTNLKDSYEIYFNGGQLQKLIHIQSGPTEAQSSDQSFISYITSSVIDSVSIYYAASQGGNGFNLPLGERGGLYLAGKCGSGGTLADSTATYTASLFNQEIYQDWFTGSLEATTLITPVKGAPYTATALAFDQLYYFNSNFFDYKQSSSYVGDKRLFVTLAEKHTVEDLNSGFNKSPVYTFRSGSYINEGFTQPSISTLSTAELNKVNFGTLANTLAQIGLLGTEKTNLNFNYYTNISSLSFVSPGAGHPQSFVEGGSIISKTEDATPSLLVKLNKNTHLPDGIGKNGFVIIPDNLHPHVKKNLIHFLAKAGVSLDLDTIPALDTTFERLS